MFAWNGSSAFLSGTCKTLGCHLGPLEKLFPYKSMAVLGSQNGTIKRNNPTFLEKKKKCSLPCLRGEWGLFTRITAAGIQ